MVAELPLELVLPGAARGRVAASRVCQDEQMPALGVEPASLLLPPFANGGRGESGGLMRDADEHRATIGLGVIDTIQNRYACGLRAKVVVVDMRRLTIPLDAGIFEVAHQFAFLCIHADDRVALLNKPPAQSGDAVELRSRSGCLAPNFFWLTRKENLSLRSKRATVRGLT